MDMTHLPVLVREVLEMLSVHEDGIYVDATIGLGGHSEEILSRLGRQGRIIGIDRDWEALKVTAERINDDRVILKRSNFSDLEGVVASAGIHGVDGVLFDLGVSMMQLRDLRRGFSFRSDRRLDMRMDETGDLSAWEIVNTYPEKELVRILKEYGEERAAWKIAGAIVRRRESKPIDTCSELAGIVGKTLGTHGRLHAATRTFQALRIEVNREIEELQHGLTSSLRVLKAKGRLCVISYHSLEDRVVKNFIRSKAKEGVLRPLVKKPLTPGPEERRLNASSRSAKLRGAEKL